MAARKTFEAFETEAHAIHDNRYDYSLAKLEYKGTRQKITIMCPSHGEFTKAVNSHLRGYGCNKCSGSTKSLDSFYTEALRVHGSTFDYSKVKENFVNWTTKVPIMCRKHGAFYSTLSHHIRGYGCKKCSDDGQKRNLNDVLKEAKKIHGNTCSFKNAIYVNSYTPLIATCSIHGDFEMTPHALLKGRGCQECGGTKKLTHEEYIKRATDLHGNKYDYKDTKYVSMAHKVTVFCNTCKKYFDQRASTHINTQGCKGCSDHNFGWYNKAKLYIILTDNFVGYGISTSFWLRMSVHMRKLKGENIVAVYILNFNTGKEAYDVETSIKRKFKKISHRYWH